MDRKNEKTNKTKKPQKTQNKTNPSYLHCLIVRDSKPAYYFSDLTRKDRRVLL